VHPDADRRRSRFGKLLDDAESEPDGLGWIGYANHHLVADCLDLLATVLVQQAPDYLGELRGDRGRLGIAVRLGQRREPGQIGEDERRRPSLELSWTERSDP
jgi:hypothetical protein